MKFYLSSFKLGNEVEKLKELMGTGPVGYIPNALDSPKNDLNWKTNHIKSDIDSLRSLEFKVELLDLKDYFEKEGELRKKISGLRGVWVSGGNVFVLRQAIKLSNFDRILKELQERDDFVYGGYSAAACVLSPSLKGYQIVDDANDFPYDEIKETIWDGMGLIDYAFLPHFESDHSESDDIGKEVKYCKENNIPFKTLRDGEVIIIE